MFQEIAWIEFRRSAPICHTSYRPAASRRCSRSTARPSAHKQAHLAYYKSYEAFSRTKRCASKLFAKSSKTGKTIKNIAPNCSQTLRQTKSKWESFIIKGVNNRKFYTSNLPSFKFYINVTFFSHPFFSIKRNM